MSILDRPPHTITVYPVIQVNDGYGGTQPGEGAPIEVRVYCYPQIPEDNPTGGYTDAHEWNVTARSLPAGAWARVVWQGESYVMVSAPRRYSFSRRTQHEIAVIRRG